MSLLKLEHVGDYTETKLDDDKLESGGNLPHQQLDLNAEIRVPLPHITLGQDLGGRSQSISDALEVRSQAVGGGCLGEIIRVVGHRGSGLVCGGDLMLGSRGLVRHGLCEEKAY